MSGWRVPANAIIVGAANVKGGENPPFTADDFRAIYPQFWQYETLLLPQEVLDMYIAFVDSFVKISRYHEAWKVCMAFAIAHFLTLYLQTMTAEPDADAQEVIRAGELKGLAVSKSVQDVSISYDFSTAISDLDGWAGWKLTAFGTQFATLARAYTIGGMYVW